MFCFRNWIHTKLNPNFLHSVLQKVDKKCPNYLLQIQKPNHIVNHNLYFLTHFQFQLNIQSREYTSVLLSVVACDWWVNCECLTVCSYYIAERSPTNLPLELDRFTVRCICWGHGEGSGYRCCGGCVAWICENYLRTGWILHYHRCQRSYVAEHRCGIRCSQGTSIFGST